MKKLITLFVMAFAVSFSNAQSVSDNLKWLKKNVKNMTKINVSGSIYTYSDPKIEFTTDKIRVYTKEKQEEISWAKLNQIIVTTFPGGKITSLAMDSNEQHISFDCDKDKCDEMAQKIGQVAVAFGAKTELYTRDLSKVTSADVFGRKQ